MVTMSAVLSHFRVVWSARTWRAMGYLLAGLPLGVLWFTWSVTMYVTGAALIIIWVGIPILVFAQWSMRGIGAIERQHMNGLLGSRIDTPEALAPRPGADRAQDVWQKALHWGGAHIHDPHAWRVLTWTLFRGVMGPVGFSLAIVALVIPWATLAAAVFYTVVDLGFLTIPWDEAPGGQPAWWCNWAYLAYPVAILLAVPAAWMVRGLAAVHVPVGRWALGPCESERVARATARAEIAEERVRIDQELHDSIGHMITMTIVQAGAGAHVFDTDPAFAKQALRNIEQRGRAAMGELDRIIAAIRGDEPESRAPLPGIDDLAALVDGSRAAGMTIDAVLNPPPVAPAVGRAVFGVVREALTNAAKHAPGARVSVKVLPDSDALGIRVTNGPRAAGSAAGEAHPASGRRGLAGMRDRIALLGGVSRIGPTDDGFEVLALIPLGASLAPTSEAQSPWSELRERVEP
jgi:signal transduction histidine kinase